VSLAVALFTIMGAIAAMLSAYFGFKTMGNGRRRGSSGITWTKEHGERREIVDIDDLFANYSPSVRAQAETALRRAEAEAPLRKGAQVRADLTVVLSDGTRIAVEGKSVHRQKGLERRWVVTDIDKPLSAPPATELPGWAFSFMGTRDARRYRRELEAHLWERVHDGELRAARHERWGLAVSMLVLGVVLRVRRRVERARS
jgi:hypothetical protein